MTTRTNATTTGTSGQRAAVGYVRVSTLGQAADGVSLDAQRAAIVRQAEAAGLVLLGIESDEGISGKRIDTRPGLQRAVNAACERRAVLIVYGLSRLARNTRETLGIAEQLERAGADLFSLSERIDTSGACGRMVFRMLAVLAEFERDTVAERTRFALAEKRRRGEKLGGAAPFGYRAERAGDRLALVPDDDEQATLAQMRELHQAGRSLREIGSALDASGRRARGGGRWHAKVLASILRRAEA
jgi:site-specific DNA recombinase